MGVQITRPNCSPWFN